MSILNHCPSIFSFPRVAIRCLIVIIVTSSGAQTARSQSHISGTVQNASGAGLPFVNVLLLQTSDSSLVKGGVTTEKGTYVLEEVKAGQYRLLASMIGYQQVYSAPFVVSSGGQDIVMPTLVLADAGQQLGEVTVVASKPLFEQQLDRLVVNVQSSITSAGATALDVLERSPGISVDRQNGGLHMNGKQGVMVMIDGKLSRMPLSAVVEMLRGVNAGNIEKIELIATPPAQYDADGNAGLINIVLKKNTGYGTNGSFSLMAGYGRHEKGGGTLNINYRTRKFNLFGDYSFLLDHTQQQTRNFRRVLYQEELTQTETISDRDARTVAHNARLGFDYTLSDKTVIGGLFAGFSTRWQMDADNTSRTYRGDQLTTLLNINDHELNHWSNTMANLNLRHTLPGNQQINVDLDYLYYYNNNPHRYTNSYQQLDGATNSTDQITIDKRTPLQMWVGKADYTRQLGERSRLEAGLKGTLSSVHNDVAVNRLVQSQWQRDPEFSQNMSMQEDIGAAYASFHHQFNAKTKLQTGLRWEYTRTDLSTPKAPELIKRRYGNLFPNVSLARELSAKSSLQASYSRRISRPTYNDVAPFVVLSDPYSFWAGNIALLPAITNAVQMSYKFKEHYLLTLQYSHDKNAIAGFQVRVDPVTNRQYTSPVNIDGIDTYSLMFNFPVSVASFWQMQNNLMGVYQRVSTDYLGARVNQGQPYGQINTTHRFTLPFNFSAEINAFYQSPSLQGVAIRQGFGSVNVGLQKKLKKDWGTLRLTMDDLFWTNRWETYNRNPDLYLDHEFQYLLEPRVVKLTFSRGFGNSSVKAVDRRGTSSEEERNRVGN